MTTHIKNVLDAIDAYYIQAKNSIDNVQKYDILHRELSTIINDSSDDPWEMIHILHKANNIIHKMYTFVDVVIDESSNISGSKADNLKLHLNILTNIYILYKRDFLISYDKIILKYTKLESKKNPKDLQKKFHNFPGSIDLYIACMENTDDLDQLELDKSHILNEKKYISPYLTFGLIPELKTTTDEETLLKILKPNSTYKKINKVSADGLKCDFFILYRMVQ